MKIVLFGDDKRLGVLQDNSVIDLMRAYETYLADSTAAGTSGAKVAASTFADLTRFIEGGGPALAAAQAAAEHVGANGIKGAGSNGIVHDLAKVKLHAPRPLLARIACAGANFKAHADAMANRNFAGGAMKAAAANNEKPFIWGFWKLGRDPVGPDENVIYPARATRFDYEGEAAIILGKKGKDIRAGDIGSYVWGITLFTDWSVRAPREPSGPQNFSPSKNFDTAYSIGPCIVVGEHDPMNVDIQVLVNGELRQDFNTRDMTFSFGQLLEHLSRDFTFHPGDMIASGTAAGTAADSSPVMADGTQPPELFLKPGDIVTVRSAAIGEVTNRIVAKT